MWWQHVELWTKGYFFKINNSWQHIIKFMILWEQENKTSLWFKRQVWVALMSSDSFSIRVNLSVSMLCQHTSNSTGVKTWASATSRYVLDVVLNLKRVARAFMSVCVCACVCRNVRCGSALKPESYVCERKWKTEP